MSDPAEPTTAEAQDGPDGATRSSESNATSHRHTRGYGALRLAEQMIAEQQPSDKQDLKWAHVSIAVAVGALATAVIVLLR